MLIIVESPAKAKTISRFVGKEHQVKASVGHIRSLSKDKKTKDGRALEISGIDIQKHFQPIYEIDKAKLKVVKELKQLAKKTNEILFATDSDREGEAISWHLAEILGVRDKTKIKRLEFHEITKSAIQKAMDNPRELNLSLVQAQQARQVLDKLVGFKLSPVLWKVMGNYKLSAGRVQSPALALVCQREDEIENFVAQEYWEIYGKFQANKVIQADTRIFNFESDSEKHKEQTQEIKEILLDSLKLTHIKNQRIPKNLNSKEEIDKLFDELEKYPEFKVDRITQKQEKSTPRPPFITSTLQQSASTVYGFSPRQTMQIAQKLYEGVVIDGQSTALITYMRTDSTNLSQESVAKARSYLQQKHPEFLPDKARSYKSKSRNAQEAHEAIRPTDPSLTPASLKGRLDTNLWKLYNLIWTRMVASQMTDEIRQRVNFDLMNVRNDKFTGSIAWTLKPGFKALTGEKTTKKPDLKFQEGETHFLQELIEIQKFTHPPARYSPASLIKKLEELGIGRPSTYASILSTLRERNYIESAKSTLIPTLLGRQISKLLTDNFHQVTSSEMTSQMEDNLDEISRGENTYEKVLTAFWQDFKTQVENSQGLILDNKDNYNQAKTDEKCPTCGSDMVIKNGRFGEYFQCQNDKSHIFALNYKEYEEALQKAKVEFASQAKGLKCQECGKPLIVKVAKKSLQPYIACPEYRVGNKHTVKPISYGSCPKCKEAGRKGKKAGVLVRKRGYRGKSFMGCSLDKDVCGFIQK